MDLTWMIAALAETGRDIYVLGGSGPRWEGRHEVREVYLHESVTVPKLRNVYNQIGGSAVVHASIVARCGHFVGSFSAYYCAAHACGRPTFVLTDKELARFVRLPAHPVFGGCLEDRAGARWDYFGRQSDADQIRAIVEWTRG